MSKTKGATWLSTDELVKAKTLAAAGYSYRRIGRELGRSDHAVKRAISAEVAEADVMAAQKSMSQSFDGLAGRMLGTLSDEAIGKMSPYQRIVGAAIATDKLAVLSAGPARQELVDKLTQVLDLLRQKGDAKADREHEEYAQRFHEQQRLLQLPAGKA